MHWWSKPKIQNTRNPTPGKLPLSFGLDVSKGNLSDFMHHWQFNLQSILMNDSSLRQGEI